MPPEEVGSAYIAIRASTAGFAEQARSEVNSSMAGVRESATVPVRPTVNRAEAEATIKRDLGGAVKSAMGYIGGIFAAQEVFSFGKSVVTEAAQVQKFQESIRSEYGKTGDAVERFATGTATQLGISQVASEGASAKLGALFNNLGFGQRKSADFNLELQKVVGGLSQIKGVDPTSVLDRLNTTMATGSTRGLRDLGIALDANTVKTEAFRLGLVQSTVDQGKVAAAQLKYADTQKVVTQLQNQGKQGTDAYKAAVVANTQAHEALTKATAGTHGPLTVAAKDQAILSLIGAHQNEIMQQAAAHQGDAANQMKILSAEWANAKASIGEALLPLLTSFVQELVRAVTFIRENRTEFVALAIGVGAAVAAYTAVKAAIFGYNLITEVSTGLGKLFSNGLTFQKAAVLENAAATDTATAAQEANNAAMYANPIGLVVAAIAVLVVGLYELYEHSATARRIMNELWADMRQVGGRVLGWLSDTALPAVRDAITGFVNFFRREWHRWGSDITEVVRVAIAYVSRQVRDVIAIVRDVVNLVGDLIHGRWRAVWGDAWQLVKDVVREILDRFGTIPERVGHFVERIGGAIAGEAGRLVHDAERLGSELVHGIISGIEHAPGDVGNAIKDKATGALSAVGSALGIGSPSRVFAQRIGKPISDGIILGAQPLHDNLRDQMTTQLRNLQDQYGPIWHNQFHDNVGRPIQQGVVAGTAPLQGSLGDALVSAARGAISHARAALGIHSPSSLFSEQVGKPIADGILHGMGGLEQALTQRITSAARSAAAATGGFGGATPQGSAAVGYNQRLGYQMMIAAGWPASQWGALQALWTRESGWNANAVNASSGAYGIPQSLGHGHPYNLGDARAQIAWGLDYIRGRYGSPAAAWAHEEAIGWYQHGGVQPGNPSQAYPAMLHGQEVVFTPEQMAALGGRGISIGTVVVQTPSAAEFVSDLDRIARSL